MSEPEVPVMVTVAVPVVAFELALRVTTLVEFVGLVPKLAVTPEGSPDADRVTLPVNPPEGLTVIVLFPLEPCVTVKLEGEAESEKSGFTAALTVRETVVVCVRLPEVPVMVTVAVPVAAVELALSVKELVEVVGLVPKLAVTPEGRPEADRVTLPENPFDGLTVIVLLPLEPCVIVTLEGEADSVKFGVGAAGGNTQSLAAFENSSWIVYEVPLATYVPCCPLQMSPISPLFMSYQARGGANVVAMPTSASVIASVSS